MPLEPRDAAHLWDIVEMSRNIREFTAGVKAHEYLADRKLQFVPRLAEQLEPLLPPRPPE